MQYNESGIIMLQYRCCSRFQQNKTKQTFHQFQEFNSKKDSDWFFVPRPPTNSEDSRVDSAIVPEGVEPFVT